MKFNKNYFNQLINKRIKVIAVSVCMLTAVLIVTLCDVASGFVTAYGEETDVLALESKSAILLEASTGQVIYEKDARVKSAPASITKIMTLLLIFEACENGKLSPDDTVTVSEHAASMGGSQVFLEEGEKQTVDTMIKCISVASANDACVAMAEHIAGSEDSFVAIMNEKAKALGMADTNFVNCCGLDAEGHVSTAMDIAIMSRELITRYPQIHDYSSIWMDTIIHSTRKGDKEFTLTNTNKLMKQYEWATGLKTGSTGKAGCCLSATASKDGIELIAVVLAAPNSKTRFSEAIELLNYGYSICEIFVDNNMPVLEELEIKKAKQESVGLAYERQFSYMFMDGYDKEKITNEIKVMENIELPLKKGDVVGKLHYYYDGEDIGSVNICVNEDVSAVNYGDMVKKTVLEFLIN